MISFVFSFSVIKMSLNLEDLSVDLNNRAVKANLLTKASLCKFYK